MNQWNAYIEYLHNWADEHSDEEFSGMSPACYDEFLDNDSDNWVCQECGEPTESVYTIAEWCEQLDLCDHLDQLYNIAENLDMNTTDICQDCFIKLVDKLNKE